MLIIGISHITGVIKTISELNGVKAILIKNMCLKNISKFIYIEICFVSLRELENARPEQSKNIRC